MDGTRTLLARDYDRVMSFLASPSIRPASIDLWKCPIEFIAVRNAKRLQQPTNGPCGLFAVLQAYILLNSQRFPSDDPESLLIRSVLDIMAKLRTRAFVFCQLWDASAKKMVLVSFEDRGRASSYLRESRLLHTKIGCLLLAISFIFVAGPKLISTQGMPEQAIAQNGDTTVAFVLLLITGEAVDCAAGNTRIVGGKVLVGVLSQQEIGYLQVDREASDYTVGRPLSKPTGKVWVQWTGGHFSVVQAARGGLLEYDPFLMNNQEAREVNQTHPAWSELIELAF
jgi:hypothetical protein